MCGVQFEVIVLALLSLLSCHSVCGKILPYELNENSLSGKINNLLINEPNKSMVLKKSVLRNVPDLEMSNDINTMNGGAYEERTRKTPKERFTFSFPGTKWCGPGNTADNDNDIGINQAADNCCRAHDHCDYIESGATKHNLTNEGIFTRLHCDCDRTFMSCLRKAGTNAARDVGVLYFNTIHSACYMLAPPIKDCKVWHYWFLQRRCAVYTYNTDLPDEWQWFDLPLWK